MESNGLEPERARGAAVELDTDGKRSAVVHMNGRVHRNGGVSTVMTSWLCYRGGLVGLHRLPHPIL